MHRIFGAAVFALLAVVPAPGQEAPVSPWLSEGVTYPGGDQIFWVPTYAQAREMARATGRPIFVMGGV